MWTRSGSARKGADGGVGGYTLDGSVKFVTCEASSNMNGTKVHSVTNLAILLRTSSTYPQHRALVRSLGVPCRQVALFRSR